MSEVRPESTTPLVEDNRTSRRATTSAGQHDARARNDLSASDAPTPQVLVVMGVSGTGKSTVAGILAGRLGWDLEEGDDLHPAANVAKMHAGQPLTDDDRWPWLERISAWITFHLESGLPGIITCSALKRVYRDRLRAPGVVFVHLAGTYDDIFERISKRQDHFMPPSLLDSQLATLEPLGADEAGVVVDLGQRPQQEAQAALDALGLVAPA